MTVKVSGTTQQVEVSDVRKAMGDGNLKAFANVRVADVLTIRGVCVMKGKSGLFVSMPSKLGKDGKWFETVTPDQSLKREIENKVLESYDLEVDGVKD